MGKILLAALVGIIALFGFNRKAAGASMPMNKTERLREATPYEDLFKKYSGEYNVPWEILSAISFVESSYRPNAINYLDNESIGLMQILCKPDGNGGCANKLNVDGWLGIKRSQLLDTDTNVKIGAQIIAWNIQQFGLEKGIAVYNAWDQRDRVGPFKNQKYVDKVLKKAKELGYAQ